MKIGRGRGLAIGVWAVVALGGCDIAGQSAPDLVWGVHGVKPGRLHKPRVAAFDKDDHLFLADLTDRIQVFTRDGNYFFAGSRMPAFNVDGPSGLTVDRYGRLLVADTHFYRVLVFSREGEQLFQLGDGVQATTPGRFGYPTDVVTDRAGNFYVAEYGENDRIQVFAPDGTWLRQWGGHGYEPGEFLRRALAIDDNDRIYVADSCNHRIQVFDTDGKLLRLWGHRGDKVGEMAYPYDLALGPNDTLYVCEYANHRVQKFSRDGTPLGTWGTPGRGPGQLNYPWALAVDHEGEISVIDSSNHRVQRFRM